MFKNFRCEVRDPFGNMFDYRLSAHGLKKSALVDFSGNFFPTNAWAFFSVAVFLHDPSPWQSERPAIESRISPVPATGRAVSLFDRRGILFFGKDSLRRLTPCMRVKTVSKLLLSGALVAAALWFAVEFTDRHPTQSVASRGPEEPLKSALADLNRRAASEQLEALARYDAQIDRALNSAFADSDLQVDQVVGTLIGLRGTLELIRFGVMDRATGSEETAAFVSRTMVPVVERVAVAATTGIEAPWRNFVADMDGISARFCTRARVAAQVRTSALLALHPEHIHIPAISCDGFKQVAWKTAFASLWLGLEAAFIRQTAASANVVLDYFFKRAASTGATALACAASDGPFPVGDAIAVLVSLGGSAWALSDLYDARARLVPEIRSKLNAQFLEMRDSFRKTTHERALELMNVHEKSRGQFAAEILDQ